MDYEDLRRAWGRGELTLDDLTPRLSDGWSASYRTTVQGTPDLVEVTLEQISYLFDLDLQRVVGAAGRSTPSGAARPSVRMRGFPLPPPTDRSKLVRGHLAAHSIGGGTDINLVPQSAKLNLSGRCRGLERWAQQHPGSLFAIEVSYDDDSQTPARFVYLVANEAYFHYKRFENE